ncbi:DUF3836 domain-containing protein [Prevotella sp. 10(H)]|uniref:DUF3836 domain-containing protein n=1 Tax=Prevotella sp. 10(H) TaxID=1158294 RepID=UPI0004A76E6A|nr:DUF3836 domain-containing protein [Prevotella sp. 10(H)]
MKTKILISLLAVLFFSANIFASTPETITLSNEEKTEEGSLKEVTLCDKDTNAPISKTVYRFDTDDRILEKATYEWTLDKGWVGIQKYEYTYNEENLPVPSVVKWDKKNNDWAKKAK